jgi:hypothetical protein
MGICFYCLIRFAALPVLPVFVYEGIVLHDQDRKQKSENYMAMKYQKGTVYPSGKKVKMWYGKYLIYGQDKEGKEIRKHRNVSICPKAGNPKWKAEQLLREMILKECGILTEIPSIQQDETVTFRWFAKERYIPMRQGKWSPAYKQTNTDQIERYLISKFGDFPLRKLDSFQIQIWLNGLAEGYSESVVRSCYSNNRAITAMARKPWRRRDDATDQAG